SICFVPYLIFTVIPDIVHEPIVDYSYGIWFITVFPIIFIYLSYKHSLFQFNQIWLNNVLFSFTNVLWRTAYFNSLLQLLHSLQYVKAFQDFKHHFLPDICKLYNYTGAALVLMERDNIKCWHTNCLDKQRV